MTMPRVGSSTASRQGWHSPLFSDWERKWSRTECVEVENPSSDADFLLLSPLRMWNNLSLKHCWSQNHLCYNTYKTNYKSRSPLHHQDRRNTISVHVACICSIVSDIGECTGWCKNGIAHHVFLAHRPVRWCFPTIVGMMRHIHISKPGKFESKGIAFSVSSCK